MSDAKVYESRLEHNKEEEGCVYISLAVDMMHYATIEVPCNLSEPGFCFRVPRSELGVQGSSGVQHSGLGVHDSSLRGSEFFPQGLDLG